IVGYTQVLGSFGGLMVTGAYYLLVTYGHSLPAVRGTHEAWRYTLMSGVIPAIPLILIRPFLPESPTWRAKKEAGTLKRPSFGELFQPRFSRTTIVTTVMIASAYSGAFGAIQQAPRIVPGLPELRGLPRAAIEQTVSAVQSYQEIGGLVGRFLLAFYGIATIGQFSFWGNYLPRVYPTYLRGTGESFAANVGGRMIGTMAALVTTQLANVMPAASAPTRLAYASALVGTTAYVLGLAASFWLPEPGQEELPD